jgi:hypothetical protein
MKGRKSQYFYLGLVCHHSDHTSLDSLKVSIFLHFLLVHGLKTSRRREPQSSQVYMSTNLIWGINVGFYLVKFCMCFTNTLLAIVSQVPDFHLCNSPLQYFSQLFFAVTSSFTFHKLVVCYQPDGNNKRCRSFTLVFQRSTRQVKALKEEKAGWGVDPLKSGSTHWAEKIGMSNGNQNIVKFSRSLSVTFLWSKHLFHCCISGLFLTFQ